MGAVKRGKEFRKLKPGRSSPALTRPWQPTHTAPKPLSLHRCTTTKICWTSLLLLTKCRLLAPSQTGWEQGFQRKGWRQARSVGYDLQN